MPDADVYIKTKNRLDEGQKLVLSGDIPELGCWHENYVIEAVPLEPVVEGQYLVIIKLPMNVPLKWKWAIVDEETKKVLKWEDRPDRHLYLDRNLFLIYALWNQEAQIMDKAMRTYEFVPAYVLFDPNWRKSLPVRREYHPSTSRESSSSDRGRIPQLSKEMNATREKMIELQRKWSLSDRRESMENFLQSGITTFIDENKGKDSPTSSSSPKRVSFKDKPNIVGETPPTRPPDETQNREFKNQRGLLSFGTDRPKTAKLRARQQSYEVQDRELPPDLLDFDARQIRDGESRVRDYLEHLEGEKRRKENLSKEEREKEDAEDAEDFKDSSVPRPRGREGATLLVSGAIGCAILVAVGYYTYKKLKT